MQRHGGLAGARAAGDDQRAVVGRAHRLVLLALDGRDDVAHLAGALAADRGQERAVPDDDHALERVLGRGVEQLVVDADDGRAPGADRPAAYDALRVGGRGAVEGSGGGGAPVDDDRVLGVGAQPHPADVVHGPVAVVEPPEHQPLAGLVQVGPPVGRGLRADVALVHRLGGLAGRPHALGLADERLRAQHLQPRQRPVQDRLLASHLAREVGGGVGGGHRDSLPSPPRGGRPTPGHRSRDSPATAG